MNHQEDQSESPEVSGYCADVLGAQSHPGMHACRQEYGISASASTTYNGMVTKTHGLMLSGLSRTSAANHKKLCVYKIRQPLHKLTVHGLRKRSKAQSVPGRTELDCARCSRVLKHLFL